MKWLIIILLIGISLILAYFYFPAMKMQLENLKAQAFGILSPAVIPASKVVTDSILKDVVAETGKSNFTHLNLTSSPGNGTVYPVYYQDNLGGNQLAKLQSNDDDDASQSEDDANFMNMAFGSNLIPNGHYPIQFDVVCEHWESATGVEIYYDYSLNNGTTWAGKTAVTVSTGRATVNYNLKGIVNTASKANNFVWQWKIEKSGGPGVIGYLDYCLINYTYNSPYDSIVGYWPFDGDAVNTKLTTHYDYTKYNFDGTGGGDALVNTSKCMYDDCLQLDGDGDYVNTTFISDNEITNTFTISVWMKGYAQDAGVGSFVTNRFYLRVESLDEVRFGVGTTSIVTANSPYDSSKWNFVVVTYNGSTAKIYVDNVEKLFANVGAQGAYSTTPFLIGGKDPGLGNYFNGLIDEVMIFNTSLTDAQILDTYNNQSARFVTTGTQTLINKDYLNMTTGNNMVNVSATFENNFGSNISLYLGYRPEENQTDGFSTKAFGAIYPTGIWGNGTDFWIVDDIGNFVYHTSKTGTNYTDGFSVAPCGVTYPYGIWGNGTDFWITDYADDFVYHTSKTGTNYTDGFKTSAFGSTTPYGFWGNGTDFWITDSADDFIYHTSKTGTNKTDGFSTVPFGASNPVALWGNGTDFWINDNTDDFVYHTSKTGSDYGDGFSSVPFGANTVYGIWGNGTDFWITDNYDDFVYHVGFYWQYTNAQNLSQTSYINFTVNNMTTDLGLFFTFQAGNLSNPFYTPLLYNLSIDYSALPTAPPEDTTYPTFSNYWDNNASLVGSGTGLFNVTVTSTNGTVILHINNTDILATNLTANVYNASHSFTSAGNYLYNWTAYGNGTSNNLNTSVNRYYTVNTSVSDTTFSVTLPAGTSTGVFNVSNKTYGNFPPINQTSAVPFFNISNDGNVNLNISLYINESLPSGLTLKANTNNNPAGASTIGTSAVLIKEALAPSVSIGVWLWTDFLNAVPQIIYRGQNVSVKETN